MSSGDAMVCSSTPMILRSFSSGGRSILSGGVFGEFDEAMVGEFEQSISEAVMVNCGNISIFEVFNRRFTLGIQQVRLLGLTELHILF